MPLSTLAAAAWGSDCVPIVYPPPAAAAASLEAPVSFMSKHAFPKMRSPTEQPFSCYFIFLFLAPPSSTRRGSGTKPITLPARAPVGCCVRPSRRFTRRLAVLIQRNRQLQVPLRAARRRRVHATAFELPR